MQIKWPSILSLAVAAVGFSMLVVSQKRDRQPIAQLERVKEWAYVAQEKQISATEDVRLMVIPSEFGTPLDVKCIIYKNREFQQVTIVCPGASQDDIRTPDERR